MAATSALLLIAPAVLLALALRSDVQRRAEPRQVFLVYGLPALVLIAFSLFWRLPATRIVLEMYGVAFRSEDGRALRKSVRERTPASSRVVIGDVPSRTRRNPQALFGTFVYDAGKLAIELPPPQRRAGLIATSGEGFLGAIPLQDSDAICIGDSCWAYADGSFTANGTTFRIPPRVARIPGFDWDFPLPFAKPVPATTRTYALDALQPGTTRIRSFVCHTRRGRAPLLVLLDSNVALRRGGKIVRARDAYDVQAGERISFYTLPVESPSFEAPGVVERRSGVYQPGRRSFALHFDTPEVHALTTQQLDALLLPREGAEAKKKVVALAMGDAQLVDRSLYFSGVSESVALQASSLVELSRFFPRDFRSSFRVVSPRGPVDAAVGDVFWIGASDLAAIRLLVLRPPLLLLLLALVLQFLKATSAIASRFTIAQLLFAGALEVLAGVRLLLGHRVWAMPPHNFEAAELGLVAWMMLPWIFLAASMRKNSWRLAVGGWQWTSTLAGLLVSMTFCALVVEGPRKFVWILCHLIPLAIVYVRSAPRFLGSSGPRAPAPENPRTRGPEDPAEVLRCPRDPGEAGVKTCVHRSRGQEVERLVEEPVGPFRVAEVTVEERDVRCAAATQAGKEIPRFGRVLESLGDGVHGVVRPGREIPSQQRAPSHVGWTLTTEPGLTAAVRPNVATAINIPEGGSSSGDTHSMTAGTVRPSVAIVTCTPVRSEAACSGGAANRTISLPLPITRITGWPGPARAPGST